MLNVFVETIIDYAEWFYGPPNPPKLNYKCVKQQFISNVKIRYNNLSDYIVHYKDVNSMLEDDWWKNNTRKNEWWIHQYRNQNYVEI